MTRTNGCLGFSGPFYESKVRTVTYVYEVALSMLWSGSGLTCVPDALREALSKDDPQNHHAGCAPSLLHLESEILVSYPPQSSM